VPAVPKTRDRNGLGLEKPKSEKGPARTRNRFLLGASEDFVKKMEIEKRGKRPAILLKRRPTERS